MNKHISYILPLTCLVCMGLPATAAESEQMDINLGGGANLKINNANNNKLTTPLKNFSPVTVPQSQVDLAPLAAPPTTGMINYFAGNKINTDIVDRDVKNADEAKELKKQSGLYLGKPPAVPADDQPLKDSDIADFLKDYYGYLKDQGLPSASAPIAPIAPLTHSSVSKKRQASSKSSAIKPAAKQLLANQQKLIAHSTATESQNPSSP